MPDRIRSEDIESFAQHLDMLDRGLEPAEQRALRMLLIAAMDPIERMKLRSAEEVLDADELAVLRELEREHE